MLEAQPTVAVVITTYNHSRYLADAVRSVLQQNVQAHEVLVVDDGSSDDPQSVVADFPSVRLLKQPNAGLSAARNLGLAAATSELITFLDADDLLTPRALAAGLTCFEANPDAWLVYGAHRRISDDGRQVSPAILLRCGPRPYLALLRKNIVAMHGTVMYRRSRLLNLGGFDVSLRACEDYDVYLRVALVGKIACHEELVADYRQHAANMSASHAFMLRNALAVQARYRPRATEGRELTHAFHEGGRNWRSYYSLELLRAAYRDFLRRQLIRGTRQLAQSFRLAPTQTLTHLANASTGKLRSSRPAREPRASDEQLVSVVVPAYNAARTLQRTLASVRSQTHQRLEVVIIDDGSTDETAAIAAAVAKLDSRFRVIRQANGGVARARNRGIAETSGDFIALIDADDLWHPTKIERQLSALVSAGSDCAFCYCGFRRIDPEDRIIGNNPVFRLQGRVIAQHAFVNFVGNGSALLVRRAALDAVGGYDPTLRDRGLEGVEDFELQLRLAARWQVTVVPAFLVGYRWHPAAMSIHAQRMGQARSFMFARIRDQLERVPRYAFDWGLSACLVDCGWRTARTGSLRSALQLWHQAFSADALGASASLLRIALERVQARVVSPRRSARPKPFFTQVDPDDLRDAPPIGLMRFVRLRWLQHVDRALQRSDRIAEILRTTNASNSRPRPRTAA